MTSAIVVSGCALIAGCDMRSWTVCSNRFLRPLMEGTLRREGVELQDSASSRCLRADSLPLSVWVPEVPRGLFSGDSQFREPQ
jgi:hypothetical protein